MQERTTTMGQYWYDACSREWRADEPAAPEGEGWRMEGSGMSQGTFAWFWIRDLKKEQSCAG